MTYAFAKDSRACAVCQSWAGARELSADMTLAHVPRYSAEGECRTAVSHDYGKITKSYHTCECWSPMLLLRAHGARHARTPGPSAALEGVLASNPADKRALPPLASVVPDSAATATTSNASSAAVPLVSPPVAPPPAAPAPAPVAVPPPEGCVSAPLALDRIPPMAGVLLSYWRRVKGDRPMPAATEINTAHLRDSLARLCLFAPAADGQDFEYRACGRAVRRRLDLHPAGLTIGACHDAAGGARLSADVKDCFEAGTERALLVRGDPMLPGQKFVELLLPLAGADGKMAFVLAWRNVPGG